MCLITHREGQVQEVAMSRFGTGARVACYP